MIDTVLSHYRKLKTREKALAIFFIVVIAVGLYHRFLYKPLTKDIATYKFQIQKLKTRLDELNAQCPQLAKQREKISQAEQKGGAILKNISEVEKKVPGVKDASRLTAELTRMAQRLELVSVQQKIDEGEPYSRIFVELKFNAPFNAMVDYTSRIGAISPFLKVEELTVSEPTGKKRGPGLSGTLLLSCLLMEEPVFEWSPSGEVKEKGAAAGAPSKLRDIFASQARPVVVVSEKERKKVEFNLEGIAYHPQSPNAIINDEVVTVGSVIDGYKVKAILPDSVVLTDGTEDLSLTIEQ